MGIIERRFSAIEGGPIDRIKIVACDGNMEKLLNPFGTEPTIEKENSKKRSRWIIVSFFIYVLSLKGLLRQDLRRKKFFDIFQKMTFLGVILCEKSIARIPEA
jgi:hypothetical protein